MHHIPSLLSMLDIAHPIVQAPMAGGMVTPDLVAAVSNAGALGSLACALLPPARIAEDIAAVRRKTARPFAVNLFHFPLPYIDPDAIGRARAALQPAREALGLGGDTPLPGQWCEPFDAQLEAVLAAAPPVVSFTFGIPPADCLERLRTRGCRIIGTATHVDEALAWELAGADAICVQGSEAGGHRGTFLGPFEQGLLGVLTLTLQVAARVRVPVISAGGLMTGGAIRAVLAAGAHAAQLGTAFLTCDEAGTHPAYKARLLAETRTSGGDPTVLTTAFSGRPARGLANRFIRDFDASAAPAYPLQNALTGELRQAAAKAGNTEYMSLWCGQGVRLCRPLSAVALIDALLEEKAACT